MGTHTLLIKYTNRNILIKKQNWIGIVFHWFDYIVVYGNHIEEKTKTTANRKMFLFDKTCLVSNSQ